MESLPNRWWRLPAGFALVSVSWLTLPAAETPAVRPADDPYQWLEDISGAKALDWVRTQDAATAQRLQARPEYAGLYRDALAALDSASRIPDVDQRGNMIYNFWRDPAHPRGIFRRVSIDGFRAATPAWETVLDVDALAKAEGKPWAFGGAVWPKGDNTRCLVRLSAAGGDAAEVRELDLAARAFVAGGFALPSAKSRVSWLDSDTLFVATDFGPGTMTSSGYPAVIKVWRRGTPLDQARTIYTGQLTSVGVSSRRIKTDKLDLTLVAEDTTFWEQKNFQLLRDTLVPLAIPPTARVVDGWQDKLVIALKAPWTLAGAKYPAGAVVLVEPALLRGETGRSELLVAPSASLVVGTVNVTAHGILVTALDNVRGRLYRFTADGAAWHRTAIEFPDNGALTMAATDDETGESWVKYESFLTPPSLYFVGAAAAVPELVKSQAPTFDASHFEVRQNWAVSADGTRVPYFVVQPKGLKYDGTAPVWMFSYGGFEIALTPAYSGSYEDLHGAYGKLWLERGGVFVLANIRGGGEFGPAWHQAALNENHYRAFEDFEAVARDLETRHLTSPAHLGIEGRSNC